VTDDRVPLFDDWPTVQTKAYETKIEGEYSAAALRSDSSAGSLY